MCGICGIIDFNINYLDKNNLTRMTQTLSHRGPDYQDSVLLNVAGFGHTRLSIIDLSPLGHQPMISKDQRYMITYNGEIYNFQGIRKTLIKENVQFRGNSDTEVILKAFIQWGEKSFSMFKGMFAFAIWDNKQQILYAVRDPFGIKPLYYSFISNGIIFASEIKAIITAKSDTLAMNINSFHEYLYYGTTLGEWTLFRDIFKLYPGYFIRFSKNGYNFSQYKSIYNVHPKSESFEQAKTTLYTHLESAIKRHLVSDVPIGVFLSGGIDSSTITALASRLYSSPLKTYSVGFDFARGVNELKQAQSIAKIFKTDHHELFIEGKNISHIIENLVKAHDEPFGDAADIPLYLLCQKLKGSIKVILQGDGGDEIFGGYRRYAIFANERMWKFLSKSLFLISSFIPKVTQKQRLIRFLYAMSRTDPALNMALLLTVDTPLNPPIRVFTRDFQKQLIPHDPFQKYREFYNRFSDLDAVQRMLYTDCSLILPHIFLEKVDKSTMAHGIEVRVPMLDLDLAQYTMGLPSSFKINKRQKKWILRASMRGILPNAILDAPKTGFGVPYSWWLKGHLKDYLKSTLLDDSILNTAIFNKTKLVKCIDDHISGSSNNGFLLWKLLNFALWYKIYTPVI